MKPKNLITLSLIATALCFTIVKANAKPSKPTPIAHVDLAKYAGKWYEIARLPIYFQRNCASDVTATYTANPDGSIKVDNQCQTAQAKTLEAIGKATKNGDTGSQLKVTFLPKGLRWLPFGKADYWVLALDKDYNYALVGTPNQKYLWVLSRTPTMPDSIYNTYVNLAKQQGYDVNKLIKTVQMQAK